MIIKLKQGIGRLIRSVSDIGKMVKKCGGYSDIKYFKLFCLYCLRYSDGDVL